MADAAGMHSYNSTLFWDDDQGTNPAGVDPSGAGYTQLAEVISMTGVSAARTVVEVTHLSSDDYAKEKIPGFEDGGQVTFRFNYSVAVFSALSALMPSADRIAGTGAAGVGGWGRLRWVLQLPDGGQWWFRGFLQGHPFTVPEDDRITCEATIEISGAPVFTLPD